MMKTGFYDGVSCVMTGQEARFLLRYHRELRAKYSSDRLLMVGIAESTKSLLGIPTKRTRRFAKLTEIPYIFTDDPHALNIIHYATDDLSTLAFQLMQIASHAGPNLHGFQLNTDWPDIGQLIAIRKAFKNIRIIMNLAVPMEWYKKRELNSTAIAVDICHDLNIKKYMGYIDDVLVDVSGGKGIELDPQTAKEYVEEIKSRTPWVNVGLAGGLGPKTVERLDKLIAVDKNLNIDAESALRSEDDDLDPDDSRQYLDIVGRMFSGR